MTDVKSEPGETPMLNDMESLLIQTWTAQLEAAILTADGMVAEAPHEAREEEEAAA